MLDQPIRDRSLPETTFAPEARPESRPDAYWRAGALVAHVAPLSPEASCGRVFDELVDDETRVAVPVIDAGGYVLGLVERHKLVLQFAKRFMRELYAKRPITFLMDRNPPVVDAWTPVEALSDRVVSARANDQLGDLVVTRDGQYLGIASALSLLTRLRELSDHRLREADQAKAEAERANRAKSELLANMSHELRTPLNAVIGFSEMMRDEVLGPVGNPRYREYAADIHVSGGLLLDLINDILDLSKAEAGRLELVDEAFDLAECARGSAKLMRERAARAGVVLDHRPLAPLPPVIADRRRVQQILLNLLSNAIKFTPAGGSVVVFTTRSPSGGARLVVEDSGIGIAPEDIPLVLEPFGQAAQISHRHREGTGLGLPIVRKLAHAHGGEMALASTPGLGTTVTVDLP
ncbi:MAG: histidine kinase, partial [Rhodospirillales bacterium]|nr:histidine kinase [Rhodospirillales bacterium]